MDYTEYLPYAVAILIAVPFLIHIRQFVYTYIKLKEKELELLARKPAGNDITKNQAYERMVLFLERVKPANLVMRFSPDLKPHEFLFLVEKTIAEEFDYNASQQLYIPKEIWQNIVTSKNNIVRKAQSAYANMGDQANLEDLKTVFLMDYMNGEDYIANTIEDLKSSINLNKLK